MTDKPAKPCAACGRTITWRKKWERDWERVRFCSDACRRHRPGADDQRLEAEMLRLLVSRGPSSSICPSEPARALFPHDWSDRLEQARAAARRLVAKGSAEVIQAGRPVAPSSARGPIRVRLIRR